MQPADDPPSPQSSFLLTQQHGKYGDELQALGAYRAARSHYLEALRISETIESEPAELADDEFDDDVSSLRFSQSMLDNDERFRFERLNLIALVAFDRARYSASIELLDTLLEANLDAETQQTLSLKRTHAIKLGEEQQAVLKVLEAGSGALLPITNKAREGRHDMLGVVVLRSLKDAISDLGLTGRKLSLLMSSEQQSALHQFFNQVDSQLRDVVAAVNGVAADLDALLQKLLGRIDLLIEDLVMLTRQGPESDREALLRPSVVVDNTIADKIAIGKQVLLLTTLIQPNVKSVEERLQQLNQLDSLRYSIRDRRRNAAVQLASGRLAKFVMALPTIEQPGHGIVTVHRLLHNMVAAYTSTSVSALLSGTGVVDTSRIIDNFRDDCMQAESKITAIQPRLGPALRQARANIARALSSTASPEHREALVRRAHDIFSKAIAQGQARELVPQQNEARLGMLQCNQALEVLRCRQEARLCLQGNNKEHALKWMMRAASYTPLDLLEDDVLAAADAYVSQIRARANLVAGIDLLELQCAVDSPVRDAETSISRFMVQAQALDPNDTTILNWAKAFRLRSQGMALLSKHDYARAKAVFEECTELVDSKVFHAAQQAADDLLYKADLRHAVERFQIRRRSKLDGNQDEPIPASSYKCANMRAKFVKSLLDELLGGILDDREDLEEAIQSVMQMYNVFEAVTFSDEQLGELQATCLEKLRSLRFKSMADVEGDLTEITAKWISDRMRCESGQDQRHRLLLKIVARSLTVAHHELGVELNVNNLMFGRLVSALLNCDDLAAASVVETGNWIGHELASMWRPTGGKDHYHKIASEIAKRWSERVVDASLQG